MTKKTAKDIVEEIKARQVTDGVRVTFYLSKKTYENFKKMCGPISISAVIEEWMKNEYSEWKETK